MTRMANLTPCLRNRLKTARPATRLPNLKSRSIPKVKSRLNQPKNQLEMKLIVIKLMRDYEMEMETMDLELKMENLSYQPQKMKTRFKKRLID